MILGAQPIYMPLEFFYNFLFESWWGYVNAQMHGILQDVYVEVLWPEQPFVNPRSVEVWQVQRI